MIKYGKGFSRGCRLPVFVVGLGVSVWVGGVSGRVEVPLGKV